MGQNGILVWLVEFKGEPFSPNKSTKRAALGNWEVHPPQLMHPSGMALPIERDGQKSSNFVVATQNDHAQEVLGTFGRSGGGESSWVRKLGGGSWGWRWRNHKFWEMSYDGGGTGDAWGLTQLGS